MRSLICQFNLPLWILASCLCIAAEELPAPPNQGLEIPNLHAMVTSSGYIFAGTVQNVEPIKSHRQNSVGVMRITFHVDRAYRGVRTGQILTIREWAGLWRNGARYRSGEHVMLFLYPPSKLGLTSPVPNGHLPVDSGGRIVIRSRRADAIHSPLRDHVPSDLSITLREFGLALRRAEQE